MSRKLATFSVLLVQAVSASLLLCAVAAAEQASDYIKIQTFKTHSRLSLRLDATVEVERQKASAEPSRGFEILLKGLALTDLGAPFGSEGDWLRQMDAVTEGDSRLLKVKFRETESGVVVKGTWRFPGGKAALAEPRMETFHYRKDDAYFVDFWAKPGPTAVQAKASNERRAREDRLKKAQAEVKARQDRRAQLAVARAEMEDSMRFCKEPWTEPREVFLPFFPRSLHFHLIVISLRSSRTRITRTLLRRGIQRSRSTSDWPFAFTRRKSSRSSRRPSIFLSASSRTRSS